MSVTFHHITHCTHGLATDMIRTVSVDIISIDGYILMSISMLQKIKYKETTETIINLTIHDGVCDEVTRRYVST
jgi:hypothetical protein